MHVVVVNFRTNGALSRATQVPQQQTLLDLHHKTASTSLGIRRGTAPVAQSPLLGAAGAGLSTAGFVNNSGLVMQFDAYFKEAVDESPLENHRVRKCKILVYLEDSSVQIDECRQENSGMPQGTMVKRHQIPYPEVRHRSSLYCTLLFFASFWPALDPGVRVKVRVRDWIRSMSVP